MMSVNLAESQLPSHLDRLEVDKDTIHVACVNSPTNVTLSGSSESIDLLKKSLDQLNIFAQKLNTGVAYHSQAMQAVSVEYLQTLGSLQTGSDSSKPILMISSVIGQVINSKTLVMPRYWVDNLVSPVRFADAIKRLKDSPPLLNVSPGIGVITDIIEIGPHAALRRPVKDTIPSLRYHSVLERTKSPLQTILQVLGELFCLGHEVSILAGNNQVADSLPHLVDCPPYPFGHSKRYWSESRLSRDYRLRGPSPGFLLGVPASDWNPLQPRWRNWLCTEAIPWLADHTVSLIYFIFIFLFFYFWPLFAYKHMSSYRLYI